MFVSVHFSQLFIFNADVQQIQIVRSIGLLTLVGSVTSQYQSHYIFPVLSIEARDVVMSHAIVQV